MKEGGRKDDREPSTPAESEIKDHYNEYKQERHKRVFLNGINASKNEALTKASETSWWTK